MLGRQTLLLHGGADPTASFNTFAFFVDTETWECTTSLEPASTATGITSVVEIEMPESRSDHTLVPVDSLSAFLFGGHDTRFNDIFLFENS